jgi:hypothetical protein
VEEQVTRTLLPVAAVPTASAIVITFPAALTRRMGSARIVITPNRSRCGLPSLPILQWR